MTSVAVKGGGRRRAIGVSLMVLIIVAGLVSARAAAVTEPYLATATSTRSLVTSSMRRV